MGLAVDQLSLIRSYSSSAIASIIVLANFPTCVWVSKDSSTLTSCRKERDEQIEHEALGRTIAEDAAGDGDQLRTVLPANSKDRAGLDDDLEQFRLVGAV